LGDAWVAVAQAPLDQGQGGAVAPGGAGGHGPLAFATSGLELALQVQQQLAAPPQV
jgi:hypothetical protein